MARYWRSRRWSRWNSRSDLPPTKTQKFSAEVGGGDEDVKSYFLSLPSYELAALFQDYGEKYGASKRQYAEKAYAEWKSGIRAMGVLVKTRLYAFLPKRMPLEKKYEVVRKLWESSRPKPHSYKTFYVGKGANPARLRNQLLSHYGNVVQDHYFSDELKSKFDWLSAGDVHIRQQLQNYFEQLKREYVAHSLQERFDIIAAHLENTPENHTLQTVRIGNHVVEIKWTNLAEGLPDIEAVTKLQNEMRVAEERELKARREQEQKIEARKNAFGCLFAFVLFFVLLRACAN